MSWIGWSVQMALGKYSSAFLVERGGYKATGLADAPNYPDFYSIYDVLIEFYRPHLHYETPTFVQFITGQLLEWLNNKNPFHMDMVVYAHASREAAMHQFFLKHLTDASIYRLNNDDKSSPVKIKKKVALDNALVIMMNLTFDNKNSQDIASVKAAYQILLKFKQRVHKSSTLLKEYEKLKKTGVVDFYHRNWREAGSHNDPKRQKEIDDFPMPPDELIQYLKGERH